MTTVKVKRWRIYCNTESIYIDGYLNQSMNAPSVCFNNDGHTIDTAKTELIEIIENNYTQKVIKWKIHCDTETADITGYVNSELGSPTKCFNNNTHTISGIPEKLEIISNSLVKVLEQTKPLNGCFRAETLKIDILPHEIKIFDKIWDIDIAPLSVNILSNTIHINDTLQVDVSPDKVIGTLTQDADISDVILNVSSTVLKYCEIGFLVGVTDGTNFNYCGIVTYIDYINSTVTINTPLTNNFLAVTPTMICINVRMLGPHEFGDSYGVRLGDTKLGASFIPKGEIVRSTYTNNSNNYKELYIIVEYLY